MTIALMDAPVLVACNSGIHRENEPADDLYKIVSGTVRTLEVLDHSCPARTARPVGNLLSRTCKTGAQVPDSKLHDVSVGIAPIGRDVDAEFFAHGKYRDVFAQDLSFDDPEGNGGLATLHGYDSYLSVDYISKLWYGFASSLMRGVFRRRS